MDGVTLKKSNITKLDVKKATIENGMVVADGGEMVDLTQMLKDNFDGRVVDISIKEKLDEEVDV